MGQRSVAPPSPLGETDVGAQARGIAHALPWSFRERAAARRPKAAESDARMAGEQACLYRSGRAGVKRIPGGKRSAHPICRPRPRGWAARSTRGHSLAKRPRARRKPCRGSGRSRGAGQPGRCRPRGRLGDLGARPRRASLGGSGSAGNRETMNDYLHGWPPRETRRRLAGGWDNGRVRAGGRNADGARWAPSCVKAGRASERWGLSWAGTATAPSDRAGAGVSARAAHPAPGRGTP